MRTKAIQIGIWVIGLFALVIGAASVTVFASAPMSLSYPALAQARPMAHAPSVPYAPACGPDWEVVPSSNMGTAYVYLAGAAAISGSDVWAVGTYFNGSVYQTLVEHWDGMVWSAVSSPNVGNNYNVLNAVTAIGSSNVWAVGWYQDKVSGKQTVIEHWDGSTWSVVPSPNMEEVDDVLTGVAAVSANDVWAVGTNGQTLIEHWDGSVWSVIASPNAGAFDTLTGVSAVGAGDVWAVGYYQNEFAYQTLIEHWDGSTWSVVPSPNVDTGNNVLNAVTAAGSGNV